MQALEAKILKAAAHLDDARDDILAFTAFPREIWRQVWSNNPQEPSQQVLVKLVSDGMDAWA